MSAQVGGMEKPNRKNNFHVQFLFLLNIIKFLTKTGLYVVDFLNYQPQRVEHNGEKYEMTLQK